MPSEDFALGVGVNLVLRGSSGSVSLAGAATSDHTLTLPATAAGSDKILFDDGGSGTLNWLAPGTGLAISGTNLAVDLSELTDMTATMVGSDEFIVLDAGADRRKAASEIGLSIFNNDSGFTTNAGTVTSIGTSSPITGGTITGSGTIGLDDPINLSQLTESTDAIDDKILLWDESASSWKYMRLDDLQDSIDTNTTYSAGTGVDLTSTTFSLDLTEVMANNTTANAVLTSDGDGTLTAETNVLYSTTNGLEIKDEAYSYGTNIVSLGTNTSLTRTTHSGRYIRCTAGITLTLPASATVGEHYTIINDSTGTVTINVANPLSGESINGGGSVSITSRYKAISVIAFTSTPVWVGLGA